MREARVSSGHGSCERRLAMLAMIASGALSACSEDSADPANAGGIGASGSAGQNTGGQTATAAAGGETAAAGTSAAGSTAGGGTAGGSGGSAGAQPLIAFDFAEDVQGWVFVYAEPASLVAPPPAGDAGAEPPPEGVATAAHDAAGDPTGNPGSVLLELPFSAPAQKISFEVTVAEDDAGLNLQARSISARISVAAGYATDPSNPAGLKLYVKTGPTSLYADSGYLNIAPGAEWQTFSWPNVSAPMYTDPAGTHDPTDVRQIGIEFDTGGAGTYLPATVLLDTVAVY